MNTFNVGDTIVVTSKIKEKDKERLTKFRGIVIAKKGAGISKTFIVRKIAKGNIGVERIFPLHSPNITDIKITRRGKVRRAKLYYLRELTGKAAMYVRPATEKKEVSKSKKRSPSKPATKKSE